MLPSDSQACMQVFVLPFIMPCPLWPWQHRIGHTLHVKIMWLKHTCSSMGTELHRSAHECHTAHHTACAGTDSVPSQIVTSKLGPYLVHQLTNDLHLTQVAITHGSGAYRLIVRFADGAQ